MDRLYNKYRPNKFSEVVGQNYTTTILKGIIRNRTFKYNREFIFSSSVGGVSKTTLAKIFARAINCDNPVDGEPCNECKYCKKFLEGSYLDYMEFDGAEYNSVESVSKILALASQKPIVNGKFKVIVINEFQRVSSAAMSKFLDLLEFGHNKTIFIFTTTDIKSILQPITTRCFNFEINSISGVNIKNFIIDICNKEGIDYEDKSINKIVTSSKGSLREAIKMVDLYSSSLGEIRDIIITNKYNTIAKFITSTAIDKLKQMTMDIYKYPDDDVFESVLSVISDYTFNYNKPIYVSEGLMSKTYSLVEPMLKDLTDAILKYKPNSINSLVLCLNTINIRSTAKADDKTISKRRFVKNIDEVKESVVSSGLDELNSKFKKLGSLK